MSEVIYLRDGKAVSLRPCPSWCTLSKHFAEDDVVYPDDGFHHYGPEIAVPTSYQELADAPRSVVKVSLKAWTHPLDAEPGPDRIELQLATTEYNTDSYVELTPDQARAVATALLKIADTTSSNDAQ